MTTLTFMSVNVRVDREAADPRLRGTLGSSFREPSMEGASLSTPEKEEAGAGVLSWSPSKPLGCSLGKHRSSSSSGSTEGPWDDVSIHSIFSVTFK